MVNNHYRWDFIGLSTDEKPTPQTSEKVVNGSTFYTSDNSKLYVWCDGSWYEKVVSGGGGGTSDFEQLTNRPKYNGTVMTGDTNIPEVVNSAFTGTDGTAAGTAGLVPAPATTDAGKFLKADGTWDDAGGSGGGVTILTSADYNYHSSGDTDNGVAPWLLEPGLYFAPAGVYIYTTASRVEAGGYSLYVSSKNSNYTEVFHSASGSVSWVKSVYDNATGNRNVNGSFLSTQNVVDSLTSTSTTAPLSANQGKVLNDKITALEARVAALEGN